MKRIAIIGGGITALSAAFYLEKARRAGADLGFTLFEQSDRLGGALLSEQVEGCLVEAGADSFLTEKPWAAELCQELGIRDQLIGSNDAQRRTFIVRKKKLVPLPAGMTFFVPTDRKAIEKSDLFSARGKQRILREESRQPSAELSGDVSVGDFVERHFGSEMLERVADPLLAGIYGGDARRLSMQAVLPRFLEMERRCGSLIRAMKETKVAAGPAKALFTSLKHGMRQLVRVLTEHLPHGAAQVDAEVTGFEFKGAKWRLIAKGLKHEFDAVLIATPAYTAAGFLKVISPEAAKFLRKIAYSSSVTVALGFRRDELPALRGFGFLAPHGEGRRALACTYVHNKFPNRIPADLALLRVFFGGVHDEAAVRLKEDELVRLARVELRTLLKVTSEPLFARVHRWQRAMPQYNLGHSELIQKIAQAAATVPGLILAGSAYQGVGVSDCVRQGRDAARQITGGTGT
ncbi:MAG: protoporphyrinogen oxidase [Acidobacteriales bacterium]|nr:protoporphyrinogen oxidase [Terriglobales bacterium]